MMDRPTLSLLIPAYNASAFLPRLLSSARAQSEPFDEICVYDDCSTDDTSAVAERFGARVLRGNANRGCSAGKNALAKHVETDWMHFHDADDELLPNFVSLARRWIRDGRYDVVLFNYEAREVATNRSYFAVFDPRDIAKDTRSYAIRTQINPFCGLYKRTAYLAAGGYDEDPAVLFNEDVAFHIRMAFAGLSFAVEKEVAIINHCRVGSMSSANKSKCVQAHYRVLEKIALTPEAEPYGREIVERLWGVAGCAGAFDDWETVRNAIALISRLHRQVPVSAGSVGFRAIARLSPHIAIRLREQLVRACKPHLRRHLG